MTASDKSNSYPLARGFIDSIRLNLAHYLWKKGFPYLIHPSIALKDRQDLRIADVGCGTGIWLLEVSEEYPTAAQLDGFDLALHQSPAKPLLPANVDFKYLDIHKDIPAEHVGKYDLVNVRFMIALVQNQDPAPLLQNLMKLLKPGGYIQWADADTSSDEYSGLEENGIAKENSSLRNLREALNAMNPSLSATWPRRLPDIFKEQGLVDVAFDKRQSITTDKRFLLFNAQIFLATITDILSGIPDGDMKNSMTQLVNGADEEAKKGVTWLSDTLVVAGRKQT